MVVLDCGEKRLGLARFVDKQEKHHGRHAAIAFATLPAASCRNSPLLGDCLAGTAKFGRKVLQLRRAVPHRQHRLGVPGDLNFDCAAKATSRMSHGVSFLSSYPIELEMTDQADLRQGTSIDTRFL